ncbi:MAG TPA: leucyl/phenylalanyl-tRNA--protein transferase [Candidatus Margulisiibacteriota bacterium]|nr:leucyl/phenylalanyl-tRNA--protein transferase [Candidatus Margulisiibacteriota bacterium]
MPVSAFPDPRSANPEGVVAIGGDLHPESLLLAYRQGIFPWPVEGLPLLWFSPAERGVLEFAHLHVARSLARARKRTALRFTIDAAFAAVIRACADTPRPAQNGTWITPQIVAAYTRLHRMGIAHSVEAWNGARLVGGIYGVDVDGAFAAESMFYHEPYASKLALLYLVDHLRRHGLDWLDIQVLTPHLARLGARPLPRDEFLEKLRRTRARGLCLFP